MSPTPLAEKASLRVWKPHYIPGTSLRAAVLLVLYGTHLKYRESAIQMHVSVDRTRKCIKMAIQTKTHENTLPSTTFSGVFGITGIFLASPGTGCQGCQNICLDGACQGVKVLSPDIFVSNWYYNINTAQKSSTISLVAIDAQSTEILKCTAFCALNSQGCSCIPGISCTIDNCSMCG